MFIFKKKEDNFNLVVQYIKLFFIFLITIVMILMFRSFYLTSLGYELGIPVIKESLKNEIREVDFPNYIKENPNSIIYMCKVNESICRKYERKLNNIINEKNLNNLITYFNIQNLDYVKNMLGEKIDSYPALIVFKDSKIKSYLVIDNIDDSYDKTIKFINSEKIEVKEENND